MSNPFSLTPEAIQYTWQQLLKRCGAAISKANETDVYINDLKLGYAIPKEKTDYNIVVVPCGSGSWHLLLTRQMKTIDWVKGSEVQPQGVKKDIPFNAVPVLFWADGFENGATPFVEQREDGLIIFYADILAATFFMLTRWEEMASTNLDCHDRFPATSSVAWRQGFLDRPVIDEYALILQAWIKKIKPRWEPKLNQYDVKISHDVDSVSSVTLRSLAGDIIKRRQPLAAIRNAIQYMNFSNDPHLRGCYELAKISEQNNLASSFYFMSAKKSLYNRGYDIKNPLVAKMIQDLKERGHEIGFHPGYESYCNPDIFMQEKRQMDNALGLSSYGGRQHYLRFSVPYTWRLWEQAGLSYDSTMGYADYEGFRCGTCHPFHPFDLEENRMLDIMEIPLIVMDATLRKYRKYTPKEGCVRILELAKRCKVVGGVFTLLWHNTSLKRDWGPWQSELENTLEDLSCLGSSA